MVVLSLFDLSGVMVTPWINDGYDAWIVDIEHKPGIERVSIGDRTLCRVGADLKGGVGYPG